MSGVCMPAMSCPSNSIRPEAGVTNPANVFKSVDFPAPLRPEQCDDLAFAHIQRRVAEDMALAVEGIEAFAAQQRHVADAPGAATGERRRARTGVDLLHAAIGSDLGVPAISTWPVAYWLWGMTRGTNVVARGPAATARPTRLKVSPETPRGFGDKTVQTQSRLAAASVSRPVWRRHDDKLGSFCKIGARKFSLAGLVKRDVH